MHTNAHHFGFVCFGAHVFANSQNANHARTDLLHTYSMMTGRIAHIHCANEMKEKFNWNDQNLCLDEESAERVRHTVPYSYTRRSRDRIEDHSWCTHSEYSVIRISGGHVPLCAHSLLCTPDSIDWRELET